jgi:Protein  of unknown function (DUF3018)
MARHRTARRQQGMRPVQIWVPDTQTPAFAAEARRACEIVNDAPDQQESMDWLEHVAILDEPDGAR